MKERSGVNTGLIQLEQQKFLLIKYMDKGIDPFILKTKRRKTNAFGRSR
jgi:hypothetical protein